MFAFIIAGLVIFTAGSFKKQKDVLPDNIGAK